MREGPGDLVITPARPHAHNGSARQSQVKRAVGPVLWCSSTPTQRCVRLIQVTAVRLSSIHALRRHASLGRKMSSPRTGRHHLRELSSARKPIWLVSSLPETFDRAGKTCRTTSDGTQKAGRSLFTRPARDTLMRIRRCGAWTVVVHTGNSKSQDRPQHETYEQTQRKPRLSLSPDSQNCRPANHPTTSQHPTITRPSHS